MAGNQVRKASLLRSSPEVLIPVILLAFLFIAPWFYGLTRFQDQLFAQSFIFSLFLTAVPFLNRKQGFKVGRNPFDTYVFLFLVAGFFYVLFSALPYQSLLAFLRLLSGVLFYRLTRSVVRTDKSLRVFLWAILVMGLFYSLYGLLQYYGFLPHSFWYQPVSLASRYVNGGHFAALLLFPLFIGISLLASSRRVISQGLVISFLLVMGWALLLTRARAVWIAFLVGLVLFVSLGRQRRFFSRKTISGALVLLGIGGFVFLSRGGFEEIRRRFGELWGMHFYSLFYRGELWRGALSAITNRPWGWGLGTLSSVLPQFRPQSDRFFIDYVHNEFLQVGVDLGIPGLLLLAGLVFFYIRRAWLFLKSEEVADSQKAIGSAFLALWVSLVLVSQVDFPLRIYATGVLFSTFLALSACLFELPGGEGERVIKKGVWIIPWALVFIANFVTTTQLFADFHFNEGKKLDENFAWGKAEREYEKAIRLSPSFGFYHEALGFLYDRRSGITFNRSERRTLLEKAIRSYQEASRLQPYRASTRYFLALLYERKEDFLHAQSEFLKAIALEPTNGLFLSEYGYFALRHSLVEEAIGAFEKLKNMPFQGEAKGDFRTIVRLCYPLTQDYDQLRRIVLDGVAGHFDFGQLLGEKGRWDLARKEFEEAMTIAKKVSSDEKQYFENTGRPIADFYLTHGRFQEALEIYEKAAARSPSDEGVKRKVEELRQKIHSVPPLGTAQ